MHGCAGRGLGNGRRGAGGDESSGARGHINDYAWNAAAGGGYAQRGCDVHLQCARMSRVVTLAPLSRSPSDRAR